MLRKRFSRVFWTSLLTALASDAGAGERPDETVVMPAVEVVGQKHARERIPGSAHVLEQKELESSRVFTVNEALRKIPGVNVRDEEGFGLRPNIGIRGLNPSRSTKVTLLEDGIPLAYAPYGDNASYYHPPIDRFVRIEVLKGTWQSMFGPQTIGGTINYITPTPPQHFAASVGLAGGNRDYFNGKIRIGGHGMLLDYTRKQGAGARDNVSAALNDLNWKSVHALTANQSLTLRANYFTESSMVTYSGLTEAEYRLLGPRYNPFRNDRFDARRLGLSATHELDLGKGRQVTTNVYYSYFSRDWWRQASSSSDSQCGRGFLEQRLAGLPVNVDACASIQGRLRDYEVMGVEPRLRLPYSFAGISGEWQGGLRAHFEKQVRKQVNGDSPTARSGILVEDNLRRTQAYSGFLLNSIDMGRWTLVPAIRYEYIAFDRRDQLTGRGGSNWLDRWLPGVGLLYRPSSSLTLFADIHRGFAPPRVEDVINGIGTATEVGPEDSTNFELGFRAQPDAALRLEFALFRSYFQRMIAVGSVAGGNLPLSEGRAATTGIEFSGSWKGAQGPYGRATLTWIPIAEQRDVFRQVLGGTPVPGSAAGRRLPYSPAMQSTAAIGYARDGLDLQLEAVYVGSQFSDFGETRRAAAFGNAQIGEIPSYLIWNASLNYEIKATRSTFFVTVKNLADRTFIVDRTRGILVGIPRLIQAGVVQRF